VIDEDATLPVPPLLLGVTLTVPLLVNVMGPHDAVLQPAVPGPLHAQLVGAPPPLQVTVKVA
jgi:hypothetical protein